MIRLYGPEELRRADAKATDAFGMPSLLLMENAGRNAADLIIDRFSPSETLILAGKGNNGGDGFVIARHLALRGFPVEILLAAPFADYRGDAATNLKILRSLGTRCRESSSLEDEELSAVIASASLIVDALLGTGSKGAPRGEVHRLIAALSAGIPTVALDIPSGVDGMTGQVAGLAVRADLTVSFGASKPGLHVMPGAARAGTVVVVDVGIAVERLLPEDSKTLLCGPDDLRPFLRRHPMNLHKGRRGTLLVLGGSRRYQGAPLLAALGALRAGSGVVVVALPEENLAAASSFLPEAIFEPLPCKGETITSSCLETILTWQERADAMILGPGLGRSREIRSLVTALWERWSKPLLVDGDGLWGLAEGRAVLSRRGDSLLTPHEGEAGHLLDKAPSSVAASRLEGVRCLADSWGTVLLKGWDSLIDDGRRTWIASLGDSSLAIPGSGDVLSGFIGAFLIQGHGPSQSALAGALLHGLAGSRWAAVRGKDGLLAREIAETAPAVLVDFT